MWFPNQAGLLVLVSGSCIPNLIKAIRNNSFIYELPPFNRLILKECMNPEENL
jgi:hypothetical protein